MTGRFLSTAITRRDYSNSMDAKDIGYKKIY